MCITKEKLIEISIAKLDDFNHFKEQAHLYSSAKHNCNSGSLVRNYYSIGRNHFNNVYDKLKNNNRILKLNKLKLPRIK